MENRLKCQINTLVKYRQNQKSKRWSVCYTLHQVKYV